MKTIRKIALFTLISCSTLSVTSTYCMKKDHSILDTEGYRRLAKWFMSVNWYEKLLLKSAIEKAKEVEWSKVFEYIQDLKK